jgi:ankyrin repeat protein
MLVRNGAQLDLFDTSKKTFFHHACIQGESDALRTVLRLGVDPLIATREDENGDTPLIQALIWGSNDCALVLLELADVGNTISSDGWAAVHYAVKNGDADVLEAVLRHSSFVKGMRTRDGKTVDFVAMDAGTWCGKVKSLVRKFNSLT